ncbi:hypothetical protein E1212_24640 [Jiangella ureilytica]|uniref:Uncharacterized protein n=1 Tax=Jiangella ureilytica TaxID=2530374 RepID=A0A4R4RDN2_9ACTN|nr:hypothetical protein E1212_24640 [Jiangella ureilytica]
MRQWRATRPPVPRRNRRASPPDGSPVGAGPGGSHRQQHTDPGRSQLAMGKKARKRRSRKKSAANHGKRPNS